MGEFTWEGDLGQEFRKLFDTYLNVEYSENYRRTYGK
jgi:hypothetical protein